jgi:stringent starvation protein B
MDPSAEKRARLEAALAHGVVTIHLDARQPGVRVPEQFRTDHNLRLNLSLRFDPPDLTVGEWGIRETLSFARTPFKVAVPWPAIFAITGSGPGQQAWLFPEDMPAELFDAAAERYGLSGDEVDELKREASHTPSLGLAAPIDPAQPAAPFVPRVVESAPSEVPDAPKSAPDGGGGVRRGHLRVIK